MRRESIAYIRSGTLHGSSIHGGSWDVCCPWIRGELTVFRGRVVYVSNKCDVQGFGQNHDPEEKHVTARSAVGQRHTALLRPAGKGHSTQILAPALGSHTM